jgi:hypothetical protein
MRLITTRDVIREGSGPVSQGSGSKMRHYAAEAFRIGIRSGTMCKQSHGIVLFIYNIIGILL